MVKQVIGAPTLVGGVRMPLSKAVRAGDFIFVAGQIAFESSGRVADGPIETQTRLVLDSIKATLAEAGLSMADIVKTTVWLSDPRDFGRFNAVYAEYFPTDPPARSAVRADLLLDVKIEIEAVAYAPAAP
jgi:2-iminobutanoate/2-iminopropanoate deaminase